ncbi:TetR/AcrR family transcriptional regulator [Microlunatus sp. Gsoil 973]|uniref:TetR/AcrR family transcriptional regulator n=1 Tax=Microlunatus sp. Gsoil 973 TaxID=2672569 RepID=UPI0012B4FB89|nr:TetR family transcriptional regulator C-terminal domain-containing protein [Microlunatus sp. Gsoil 973]QGN34078.1 TetR family transcriptional regulator [Microlunatus sp. Gsoil 973]
MVNTIDGERRRHELSEAVWRLILRDGLGAASVRGVAQEAGLATGSVRHFFPTQSDLLVFAMRELSATVTARVQATSDSHEPAAIIDRAIAIFAELLPLTDRTQAEFTAYLEFMIRARVDPALQPVARQTVEDVRGLVITVLTDLQQLRAISGAVDPRSEAVRLHALIDGLTVQLLIAPTTLSRKDAHQTLADSLRALEQHR